VWRQRIRIRIPESFAGMCVSLIISWCKLGLVFESIRGYRTPNGTFSERSLGRSWLPCNLQGKCLSEPSSSGLAILCCLNNPHLWAAPPSSRGGGHDGVPEAAVEPGRAALMHARGRRGLELWWMEEIVSIATTFVDCAFLGKTFL